jgi:iron-sulfur cluster assembly protein
MPIMVTEKAASKVREIVEAGQKDGTLPQDRLFLRLRVVGGGCSGFQNKLDLDPEMHQERDELFEFYGVPVVIDKKSLIYLNEAVVDYHDEPFRSGFSISNPNAKSTCGCGSSYTV